MKSLALIAGIWLLLTASGWAESAEESGFREVPRTILAFYDGSNPTRLPWFTLVHKLAEMPLNHLGLVVRYHERTAPLPTLAEMADVRGVLLWTDFADLPAPNQFIQWSIKAINAGKRFVVIDVPPFKHTGGAVVPQQLVALFWKKLGLRRGAQWVKRTHGLHFRVRDPEMMDYERNLGGLALSYQERIATDNTLRVHLSIRGDGGPANDSLLVVTGPVGGYAAKSAALFNPQEDFIQWHLDPFLFFRLAFATDRLPKPDATTLSNRRIFYSHIDGDGWRNLSEIKKYRKTKASSAKVILQEVVKKYPDLPVTIAPIAGDLDLRWYGSPKTRKVAKKMFAYPHVEAGSHTYSHPLLWDFFADGDAAKERPFLKKYPPRGDSLLSGSLLERLGFRDKNRHPQMDTARWNRIPVRKKDQREVGLGKLELVHDYRVPRAYAVQPFDLNLEITGSANHITRLLPQGKRVAVIQWSGNCLPFQKAVATVRRGGMTNLNGGDTRFDGAFPSVAWVSPLGRRVGVEWQSYASASNENTYTNLWTDHFFGFKYLLDTVRNTETPRRLKPFNIYYHIYSGDKLASLNALLGNLDYARSRPLAPVETSLFAAIAEGAVTTRLFSDGQDRWLVRNRGAMQTVRFDQASLRRVAVSRSRGVLGQRHFQGSLYVALDPDVADPIVALEPYDRPAEWPADSMPYLVESRWMLRGLRWEGAHQWHFRARGYGKGEMTWKVPGRGLYRAKAHRADKSGLLLWQGQGEVDKNGLLRLEIDTPAIQPIAVTIVQQ